MAGRISKSKRQAGAHVRFVRRLDRWLKAAGVSDAAASYLAVDLADGLFAADRVRHHLRRMLKHNPRTKRGADAASGEAIDLHVYASGELRFHLNRLLRRWEREVIDVVGAEHRPRAARGRKPRA